MTTSRGIIRPIHEADGPVTTLEQLQEDLGVAAIVRAVDAGAPVYDANKILFANWSDVTLVSNLCKRAAEEPVYAKT